MTLVPLLIVAMLRNFSTSPAGAKELRKKASSFLSPPPLGENARRSGKAVENRVAISTEDAPDALQQKRPTAGHK